MTTRRINEAAPEQRRMVEPGTRREGGDVGGILSNADGGLDDALQRSTERGDEDPTGAASVGQAASGGQEPRLDLGGKSEPGSAAGASSPSRRAPSEEAPARERSAGAVERSGGGRPGGGSRSDTVAPDGDDAAAGDRQARRSGHDPDEPPDEGPIESLGRSISEVVTGPLEDDENRDPSTRAP